MDLSTQFLGLQLKNPLMVGSGPLTYSAEGVKRCAQAGAGAVVLKSLFEEQLHHDSAELSDSLAAQTGIHGEVYEYLDAGVGLRYGSRQYLKTIQTAKQEVDIPVIASINCIDTQWWRDFACEVEAAGADALELNIAVFPSALSDAARAIEDQYEAIVHVAREAVKLPIAVKMGPYFSSLPEMVLRLTRAGADGFTLFNRFYCPTIDIDAGQVVVGNQFSQANEIAPVLRALTKLADRLNADLAATTGILEGADLVRVLLAGADVAQIVTAIMTGGLGVIGEMLTFLEEWMDKHGYSCIGEFRASLCEERNPDSQFFNRYQYMAAYGTAVS